MHKAQIAFTIGALTGGNGPRRHRPPRPLLDEARAAVGLTPGEQRFLALALEAWRATNSDGRKVLKAQMKLLAQG